MEQYSNIILPGESRRRQRFYLSKAKLHHVIQLSTFMAGFGIRSIVNLQINEDANDYILTLYVVTTSLLVVTTSFVILTAMWLLPLLKTSELINSEIRRTLEAQHPARLLSFNLQEFSEKLANVSNTGVPISFGVKTFRTTASTIRLVETAWIAAGTVSVFLFTLDVIAINWVKFRYFTFNGALGGTIVLVLEIIGLGVFGLYFRCYYVRKFRNITKRVKKEDIGWREREQLRASMKETRSSSSPSRESSNFNNNNFNNNNAKIKSDYTSIIMV